MVRLVPARLPFAGVFIAAMLLTATAARAQEERPREPREPERRDTAVVRDTIPQDTAAPEPSFEYQPPSFSVAVTLGSTGTGDVQIQPVRAYRRDVHGVVLDSASLIQTLSVRGGVFGGLSATVSINRSWALRLGLGIATATLQAGYDGADDLYVLSAQRAAREATDLRGVSVESLLRYRIHSPRRVQPYVELGVAGTRWTAQGPMAGRSGLSAGLTRVEGVAGVGATIPLTDAFSARVQLSTRVFRTPVGTALPGDTVAASSALLFTARPTPTSLFADGAHELASLIRLEAGLSYDLRLRPTPRPSGEGSEPTSPPGR